MTGNTFEITDVVAVSLALMRSNSVLGECVMRDAEAAFTGGRGDSVRVRTPKRRVAQNFNGTTVYTKVEEGHVQVKLTDEPTDAAAFTTKDMTLNIESFGQQVLKPSWTPSPPTSRSPPPPCSTPPARPPEPASSRPTPSRARLVTS
ncbi:hypothetical protein [Streptomyces sp. NPDC051567]|uniref:hypothetical protein n=1 Tax=Streptomyces sp. NPDC051567 TaxID=3365660 RepID=UPI0037ABE214